MKDAGAIRRAQEKQIVADFLANMKEFPEAGVIAAIIDVSEQGDDVAAEFRCGRLACAPLHICVFADYLLTRVAAEYTALAEAGDDRARKALMRVERARAALGIKKAAGLHQ